MERCLGKARTRLRTAWSQFICSLVPTRDPRGLGKPQECRQPAEGEAGVGGRLCCKKSLPAEAAESGHRVVSSPSSQTGASDYPSPTQLHFLGRGSCFSDAQSCPTLRDPKDCSTPDLPVHHQLLELAQTRVH